MWHGRITPIVAFAKYLILVQRMRRRVSLHAAAHHSKHFNLDFYFRPSSKVGGVPVSNVLAKRGMQPYVPALVPPKNWGAHLCDSPKVFREENQTVLHLLFMLKSFLNVT